MKTLPFVLVALLALMPPALALKCYECTNDQEWIPLPLCSDKKVAIQRCGADSNRCLTLRATFKTPAPNMELKQCFTSVLCPSLCNILNGTSGGMVVSCKTKCCGDDLCNKDNEQEDVVGLTDLLPSFVRV